MKSLDGGPVINVKPGEFPRLQSGLKTRKEREAIGDDDLAVGEANGHESTSAKTGEEGLAYGCGQGGRYDCIHRVAPRLQDFDPCFGGSSVA
jgi:hypothetical protein